MRAIFGNQAKTHFSRLRARAAPFLEIRTGCFQASGPCEQYLNMSTNIH